MSLNWIRTGLLDGAWKDPNKKMANCNHRQFFCFFFSMGFSEQKSDYHKGKDHQTGWCFFLPSQKPKEKTFSVPRKPPVLKAQRWKRKKNGEMYRYCCLISKENEPPSRYIQPQHIAGNWWNKRRMNGRLKNREIKRHANRANQQVRAEKNKKSREKLLPITTKMEQS